METTESKKVLIVDDEAYIRLLIEQTLEELEEAGVVILKADNGEDAIHLAETEKPRLIFLDVMMPRLSGFEACKAIKQNPVLAGIFIVILTAKGQEYDIRAAKEAGADRYITKPFDPDELLALAREVLE